MQPYEEAEAREARWDRRCAAAPECSRCGRSVLPYDTYLEYDGLILCEQCLNALIRQTEDLEV